MTHCYYHYSCRCFVYDSWEEHREIVFYQKESAASVVAASVAVSPTLKELGTKSSILMGDVKEVGDEPLIVFLL